MKKSLVTFAAALLLAAAGAWAAEVIEIRCDKCDLKADVISGPTMEQSKLRLTNTVIYCTSCKNFGSMVTGFTPEEEKARQVDLETLKLISAGTYTDLDEFIFQCPSCPGRASIYNGAGCPKCLKGTLSRKTAAMVD